MPVLEGSRQEWLLPFSGTLMSESRARQVDPSEVQETIERAILNVKAFSSEQVATLQSIKSVTVVEPQTPDLNVLYHHLLLCLVENDFFSFLNR